MQHFQADNVCFYLVQTSDSACRSLVKAAKVSWLCNNVII